MDWYALFVTTGKEEYVENWLRIYFQEPETRILIPKRKLIERRQRKMQMILKKMFPGYVLVKMEMNLEIYSLLKRIPSLIRILNSEGYYTRIPQEEMAEILRLLGEGDVVDYSKVYLIGTKVIVKSGPLMGMEGLIKSVDRRKQRAKVMMQFTGLEKEFDLGIEVVERIT